MKNTDLTDLQKSKEKRKKELIKQCRYYKGESVSPWEKLSQGKYSSAFVWRHRFWSWEETWVVLMYNSTKINDYKLLVDNELADFMREKDISFNLADMILCKYITLIGKNSWYWLINTESFKFFFENLYLKLAPLKGNAVSKYYLFYTGGEEKDNPFELGSDNGLFWYLERMHHTSAVSDKKYQFAKGGRKGILEFIEGEIQTWLPYDDEKEKMKTYLEGYDFPVEAPENTRKRLEEEEEAKRRQEMREHERRVERYGAAKELASKFVHDDLYVDYLGEWQDKHIYRATSHAVSIWEFPLLLATEDVGYESYASLMNDERCTKIVQHFKELWQDETISQCHFYNGKRKSRSIKEDNSKSYFWEIEKMWVNETFDSWYKFTRMKSFYLKDHPVYNEEDDIKTIPLDLRVWFYIDCVEDNNLAAFPQILKDYLDLMQS